MTSITFTVNGRLNADESSALESELALVAGPGSQVRLQWYGHGRVRVRGAATPAPHGEAHRALRELQRGP